MKEAAAKKEQENKRTVRTKADLQRSAKTKRMHTRGMAKNKNKSDFQKG